MNETETRDLDLFNAKLAYTIIESLLSHNEAVNDLLALMAHALDEDVAKALTNTGDWEKYLEWDEVKSRTKKGDL
jgi:hypothetical protein